MARRSFVFARSYRFIAIALFTKPEPFTVAAKAFPLMVPVRFDGGWSPPSVIVTERVGAAQVPVVPLGGELRRRQPQRAPVPHAFTRRRRDVIRTDPRHRTRGPSLPRLQP